MEAPPVQAQPPELSNHVPESTGESPLHEHSHIPLRAVVLFFIWFFIGLAVIEIAVYATFKLNRHEAAKLSVPITGLRNEEVTHSIIPEPRLQPSLDHDVLPKVDLETMRQRDLAEFRRRHWATDAGDQVTIPDDIVKQIEQMSQPGPRRVR